MLLERYNQLLTPIKYRSIELKKYDNSEEDKKDEAFSYSDAKLITVATSLPEVSGRLQAHRLSDYRVKSFSIELLPYVSHPFDDLLKGVELHGV